MNNKEFKDKLLEAGLNAETFAKITKTPLGTVKNWLTNRKAKPTKCPDIAIAYLNLYIEHKENKIFTNKILEELKKDNTNYGKN